MHNQSCQMNGNEKNEKYRIYFVMFEFEIAQIIKIDIKIKIIEICFLTLIIVIITSITWTVCFDIIVRDVFDATPIAIKIFFS